MYERILVPIDGSSASNQALAEAIKLGKLTGARLCLVHAMQFISYPEGMPEHLQARAQHCGELILNAARIQAEGAGLKVKTKLIGAYPVRVAEAVTSEARAWGADLIVAGTHGRHGLNRFLLGSDAEQILRLSEIPVLLVRSADLAPKEQA